MHYEQVIEKYSDLESDIIEIMNDAYRRGYEAGYGAMKTEISNKLKALAKDVIEK